MPDLTVPFTFVDGPGNTASGAQVSSNFASVIANVNSLWAQQVSIEAFRVYRANPLSTGRGNALVFDTEEFDFTTGGISPSGSITINTAGVWRLGWSVGVAVTGGSTTLGSFWWSRVKIGNTARASGNTCSLPAGNSMTQISTGTTLLSLTAGATVQVDFQADTAAAATVAPGAVNTWLDAQLVRKG
jgi:hypothetical protein